MRMLKIDCGEALLFLDTNRIVSVRTDLKDAKRLKMLITLDKDTVSIFGNGVRLLIEFFEKHSIAKIEAQR